MSGPDYLIIQEKDAMDGFLSDSSLEDNSAHSERAGRHLGLKSDLSPKFTATQKKRSCTGGSVFAIKKNDAMHQKLKDLLLSIKS